MTDYTGTGRKDEFHPKYKPNLIALIGQKGCGKTTLANQLIGWRKTSFATPIKEMLEALLYHQNLNEHKVIRMIYGDLKEIPTPYLNNKSPRHAMQTLGTEWRNLIDRNLWLDIWERSINLKKEKIIVDDCRFIHEANRIKSLGGILIEINRPLMQTTTDFHPSEQEQKEIIPDLTIQNDSTPEKMLKDLIYYLNTEIP